MQPPDGVRALRALLLYVYVPVPPFWEYPFRFDISVIAKYDARVYVVSTLLGIIKVQLLQRPYTTGNGVQTDEAVCHAVPGMCLRLCVTRYRAVWQSPMCLRLCVAGRSGSP